MEDSRPHQFQSEVDLGEEVVLRGDGRPCCLLQIPYRYAMYTQNVKRVDQSSGLTRNEYCTVGLLAYCRRDLTIFGLIIISDLLHVRSVMNELDIEVFGVNSFHFYVRKHILIVYFVGVVGVFWVLLNFWRSGQKVSGDG